MKQKIGNDWGCSSAGRALASHARGRGFESPHLHHKSYIVLRMSYIAKKTESRKVGFEADPSASSGGKVSEANVSEGGRLRRKSVSDGGEGIPPSPP